MDKKEFHLALQVNKILLNEHKANKSVKHMWDKIDPENAATYYNIGNIFALSNLSKLSLCFIERRFTMFADSPNFLELDSSSVAKILSSSEVHIDSELQVYNPADAWLSNNLNECTKFSKSILMRTRLPLLSDDAKKLILSKSSNLYNNEEFAEEIKEVLRNKNYHYKNKNKSFYKSRYCNQNKFNIVVCGGVHMNTYAIRTYNTYDTVYSIDANNIGNVTVLPKMNEGPIILWLLV